MQRDSQAEDNIILQDIASYQPATLQELKFLADAYAVRGLWQDALDTYQSAISLDSNDADLYNDLGTVYEEIGEVEEGEQAYIKAIELRSNHSTAHLNLGSSYEDQGRIPDAVHEYEKCLETSSSKSERSDARRKIRAIMERDADVIQPEEYGPEVVKLTADTITGQSRQAYYLAAAMLILNSIFNLIGIITGASLIMFLNITIDLLMAVGLLQLRAGARNFTLFRAALGAIMMPIFLLITFFDPVDLAAANVASLMQTAVIVVILMQWGFAAALILILTGQSKTWRLVLAMVIFLAELGFTGVSFLSSFVFFH